ncbi:hypothetical protein [Evansella clarkii]|uniref:hypothetical protein n=1 Tax=Evansella clarkii TaxID=79879 RepID=UPI000997FF05|nr:hypothetical protein [Evansella clarkii]
MKEYNQLLDVYVDRLMKKHGITSEKVKVDKEEKERIREIVTNIQKEVENFLENQTAKKVTEADMEKTKTAEETGSTAEQQSASPAKFISAGKPLQPKLFLGNEKTRRKK